MQCRCAGAHWTDACSQVKNMTLKIGLEFAHKSWSKFRSLPETGFKYQVSSKNAMYCSWLVSLFTCMSAVEHVSDGSHTNQPH